MQRNIDKSAVLFEKSIQFSLSVPKADCTKSFDGFCTVDRS